MKSRLDVSTTADQRRDAACKGEKSYGEGPLCEGVGADHRGPH